MATKRIVVVDDDRQICSLILRCLPPPEFEVTTFSSAANALDQLSSIQPDLIISDITMPGMDGHAFFQTTKSRDGLRHVPFLFLSAINAEQEIVATMDAGADDFITKPFSPARLLVKIRAVLRLAERHGDPTSERRSDHLRGELGPHGTLTLVKFCEAEHVTGRLCVKDGDVERWADFAGGDLVEAGGHPQLPGEDAVDALLAMTRGTFSIQQKRLDPQALQQIGAGVARVDACATESAPTGPPALPGGRLARLNVRGYHITVQTEAENKPNFTVTTLVAHEGRIMRKIESAWPHALQRAGDRDVAEHQVRQQHERVMSSLSELSKTQDQPAAPAASDIDAGLLAWSISFVVEPVRDILGTVVALSILRRTHRALSEKHPTLGAFRVTDNGRVTIEREDSRQPLAVVAAISEWITMFLTESLAVSGEVQRVNVRHVTHLMEDDLERIGFYRALGPLGV